MNRVIQDPTQELQQIQVGMFANSGGLPIVVNKQSIGAVGVGVPPHTRPYGAMKFARTKRSPK